MMSYGGSQRDALTCAIIFDAFDAIEKESAVILLDPAGRTFDQAYAEISSGRKLIFICLAIIGADERDQRRSNG